MVGISAGGVDVAGAGVGMELVVVVAVFDGEELGLVGGDGGEARLNETVPELLVLLDSVTVLAESNMTCSLFGSLEAKPRSDKVKEKLSVRLPLRLDRLCWAKREPSLVRVAV